MIYVVKIANNNIAYEAYALNDDNYNLKTFEQEVNQETFETMPIPSKFVNGEWVEVTVDEYPTTDEMPDWVEPEIIEPTQAERREEAYATQKLIIYTDINGNEIEWTVDEANAYYITYLPELGETALNDLHLMIQQAKQVIREQFPDPVTMSMLPIESGFKLKVVTL